MEIINTSELSHIVNLTENKRFIISIAGAPASGKSTIADNLLTSLNENYPNSAAVIPMDGFHLDDDLLKSQGLHEVKGAPETFDVGGFKSLLERLKANNEPEIIIPIFDRSLEISRAGAQAISSEVKYIIVEGNYLLLDQEEWKDMRNIYDLSVFVNVPMETIKQRLQQRWGDYNYSDLEIDQKINENDLPNAELVLRNSVKADYIIEN